MIGCQSALLVEQVMFHNYLTGKLKRKYSILDLNSTENCKVTEDSQKKKPHTHKLHKMSLIEGELWEIFESTYWWKQSWLLHRKGSNPKWGMGKLNQWLSGLNFNSDSVLKQLWKTWKTFHYVIGKQYMSSCFDDHTSYSNTHKFNQSIMFAFVRPPPLKPSLHE